MTARIKAIQQQIVKAMEAGKDTSALLKELADVRAAIAMEAEKAELEKIVSARKALKDKAELIQAKVQKQGEAIDAFLKARDFVVEGLAPLLEKVKELPALHDECFAQFHDPMVAGYTFQEAKGFLPADLTVPYLQLGQGTTNAYDASRQALYYLAAGYGLLANLKRIETKPQQPQKDSILDVDDEPGFEAVTNCSVCLNEKAAEINKALQQGRPLRELETEFNISRSTLSRHKRKCLRIEVGGS